MRDVTGIETREERYQNAMLRKYLLYRGIQPEIIIKKGGG